MHRKISVRNQNTHIRNTIIFAVLGFGLIWGGISLVNFWKGDISVAEDSSGLVPGTGGQILYAYLEAGDVVEATLRAIPFAEGGPLLPGEDDSGANYCMTLGQAPDSIYCNPGYPLSLSPESAKVTISGPGGKSYTANFADDFNRNDIINGTARTVVSAASLPSDSVTPTVWRVQIEQDPALNMRFRWEVNVKNGGTKKPGRVWADEVRISQINSKELPRNSEGEAIDLVYYTQRSDGYRYKITQKGYNGFGSTLKVGAFGIGLPEENGCVSAYASVEMPRDASGNNWSETWAPIYVPDPLGKQGKSLDNLERCSGMASYRIFFDEPDPALPSAPVPNWNGSPVLNLYSAEPTMPEITAYFDSTSNYTGSAVIANNDSYFGNAVLELDTDGDNLDNYDVQIPFGIVSPVTRISLDGTKNNKGGAKIPMGTLVKGRVVLSYLGEIHIISLDIEERARGIEVERKNGGSDNKYALFWNDDAPWLSAARNTTTPQKKSALPAGTNSQGGVHGWLMPNTYVECTESFSSWAITDAMKTAFTNNNVICPFDKIGHFNERNLQTWGDNRAIEDWTYDIGRTALLQQQVRDDSYFEYMFVDCTVTSAQFTAYLAYLRRNGASETEIAEAIAKQALCPVGPNPDPDPEPDEPNCKMTLAELIAFYDGDTAKAIAFREKCDSGGDPPVKPPTSGGHQYYFY
jgi:hypothetical protein